MKVWKFSVTKVDGKIQWWEPIEVDLPEETANKFKWDRMNRLDFMGTDEDPNGKVVFLAATKAEIDAFHSGFYQRGELEKTWDSWFSEENRQKAMRELNNEVE